MARTAVLLLLSFGAASQVFPQSGSQDPAFAKVPFNQWLAGEEQSQMRWTARVSRARLSNHQRLLARVEVQLDGMELAKRRGKGMLVIFFQLTDRDGRSYQDHGSIDLEKVEAGVSTEDIIYTESAFVLPGDYRVSLAIFDTATGEHSAKEESLHIPPLKNDPLPDAWRDLPAIEFIRSAGPPDSWYLPMVTKRLHLPLKTRCPVRMEVIVNLTPSQWVSGARQIQESALRVLIPALKAISQIDFQNASFNVELLDLSRRRVTFRQEQVRDLEWPRMKAALAGRDSATIDLKSLQDRKQNAAFFVAEVGRKIGAAQDKSSRSESGPSRVLLILSGPMEFERGEDLHPIRLTPTPDCRVFYIRYHSQRMRPTAPAPALIRPDRWGRMGSRTPPGAGPELQIDQLEPTLKPLAPRLLDVETPEQFRKALAAILSEISSM